MKRLYPIDPIDAYVGERLRLARNMRGLSQSYLGGCVDVTFQQIQKYETGANRISASKLAWLARILGVPIHFFYQGMPTEYHGGGAPIAPKDELPETEKDIMFRRETYELLRTYYAVNEDRRRSIRGLLKSMAEDTLDNNPEYKSPLH